MRPSQKEKEQTEAIEAELFITEADIEAFAAAQIDSRLEAHSHGEVQP